MQEEISLPKKQRTFVLITSILASGMAFIDGTALNVALPAIQQDLDLTGSELLWVVNAYTLFLAALILIGGSLGDIYGKKKIFVLGISIFTVFSIFCGLSDTATWLIISRGFQGIGAAIMIPGSLSLITASYPEATRGRAIGTWSMLSAVTTVLGPVLGGYLAEIGLWQGIFYINVPLAMVCLFLLIFKIDEPVAPKDQKPDWTGGLIATLGFTGITFGFIQASEQTFQHWWIWLSIVLGTAAFILFIVYESRIKNPMLPMKLFRSASFSGANALTFFVYGALGVLLLFLPLNLVQAQGYPAYLAGLAILPFGITIALLSRLAGKWTDLKGAKMPLIYGPAIVGIAFIGMGYIGSTSGFADFWTTYFPMLVVAGIGMGITVVPLTTVVMNCVTQENSGVASGVNNSVSRFANVLAIAIIGSVAVLSFQKTLPKNVAKLDIEQSQLDYMTVQAANFAEASPNENWPIETQIKVQEVVRNSFIRVFNLICFICAGLCFIGTLVAVLFISRFPEKASLE